MRLAAQVYRAAIPPALRELLSEHGTRRVLAAITAELAARTPAELADRIGARWQHWRYRIEDITDPVAVAITLTRRGYHCPDLRCEDHVRLDTGQSCQACADIGAQITRNRLTAVHATDPALSGSTAPVGRPACLPDLADPGTFLPADPGDPPRLHVVRDRPPWCGRCGETDRMTELPDGMVARCPACHPNPPNPHRRIP
ncbi:hypothetical protein Aple_081400 [Acrocarpospora pleiomorpha]|uniref:Uncharacterized protein n=1 Tax=Acrocarpospora pleiomorpha TaxID=90975 RepID=A0A5M3Y0B2_9ACTN|nr:hypothetical protein [Acrocarpospora pleiomorpha]GES25241.1 hypothetical protein Aple_081400 [Acrocarpospora pleiomorpha]